MLTFHVTFYVNAIIAFMAMDGLSLTEPERLYYSKMAGRYEATEEYSEAASK